ncbi:MAG TPA: alanine--glyoxylate aminotransferase family protein [Thermoplasmata archaeon]|nr:alanine--glyoxylate aminotransferase family protein [Thermoplasmata archaeon]
MTFDPETATFLIAGPVRIHPRVLRAMSMSSLNHRGDYFHGIMAEIRDLLPVMFGTAGAQAVLSGSGTSGLEAMYSSLLRKDDKTIVLSNGNFGERSDKIARRYCDRVTTLTAPWGQHFPHEELLRELEKGPVRAVCTVYNETSVGLCNDLSKIAPAIKKSGALFLVDGISAVAGVPTPIQEWGIDALVAGSQKGLAAPAGLAMVHLSERAVGELRSGTFYLDLAEHLKSFQKNDTPWTPAVPLFLALREALVLLKEEGLDERLRRTHDLAAAARAAAEALGLELFPDPRYASDTVTALKNPTGLDDAAVRKVLQNRYNVLLQGGQGQLAGKIFRLGHMGIANWSDLLITYAGLERILAKAGRLDKPGASLTAIGVRMPAA